MLIINQALNNLDILDLQTGTVLGTLKDPIINPNNLKIVAFTCQGPMLDSSSVLHIDDIREYNHDGVIIDSSESIMPLSADLVRLQEIYALNFTLINKLVIDQNGQKLGKVESYAVDSDEFEIKQLRVPQKLTRGLNASSLLIHRQQIVEVTDRHVMVRVPNVPAQDSARRSWLPNLLSPTQRRTANQSQIVQPDK